MDGVEGLDGAELAAGEAAGVAVGAELLLDCCGVPLVDDEGCIAGGIVTVVVLVADVAAGVEEGVD